MNGLKHWVEIIGGDMQRKRWSVSFLFRLERLIMYGLLPTEGYSLKAASLLRSAC